MAEKKTKKNSLVIPRYPLDSQEDMDKRVDDFRKLEDPNSSCLVGIMPYAFFYEVERDWSSQTDESDTVWICKRDTHGGMKTTEGGKKSVAALKLPGILMLEKGQKHENYVIVLLDNQTYAVFSGYVYGIASKTV